jgi:excisionase family DNA binding protein
MELKTRLLFINAYNMNSMSDKQFYTVEQVAELLQVHWQSVLNYIKRGELKALKLGKGYRISQTALDKFIDSRSTNGKKS